MKYSSSVRRHFSRSRLNGESVVNRSMGRSPLTAVKLALALVLGDGGPDVEVTGASLDAAEIVLAAWLFAGTAAESDEVGASDGASDDAAAADV